MKIAIVGSHGTGKTSLINKLQSLPEFMRYEFYPEAMRDIRRLGFPCNEKADDCSQLAMGALHLLHLKQDYMVTDRCLLDNYVYANFLKSTGSNISQYCVDTLLHYFEQTKNDITIYAFCPVEFGLVNDGFRMQDTEVQEKISYEILKLLYTNFSSERYILLHGETPERVEQLLKFKNLMENL